MQRPSWLTRLSIRRIVPMRLAKRSALVAAAASIFALIPATAAHADVIVPPGGSGHVCSTYKYANAYVYWQTCAWADNNEVYFTVHLGNTSPSSTQYVTIDHGYVRNGSGAYCQYGYQNWPIPPSSVNHTPTAYCAFPRSRAAYQAFAWVKMAAADPDDPDSWKYNISDTLQVQ